MRRHPIHLHMTADGRIHDQYCRCTDCKPRPEVMAAINARALLRLKIALVVAGFYTTGLIGCSLLR